jgi:uncharacterized protein YjbI with pentapeptide repeats
MKAVKATVAVVALSLALSVGGAVMSPPKPASAKAFGVTGQACNALSGQYLPNLPMGLNLRFVNLSNCNLSGANLGYDNLSWSNLSGANLSGVNLTGANLTGVNLTGVNLTVANLTSASLWGANLTDANLTGANLTGAFLRAGLWSGTNLTGVRGYGSANKYGQVFSRTTICPNGKKYGTNGANC